MSDDTIVSAEILLRDPAAADKVATKMEEMDIEVVSVGSRSVSVQGNKDRFESAFGVRLVPSGEQSSPGLDHGPIGGPGVEAEEPPKVPAELQEEVESIEVQQPPLLF